MASMRPLDLLKEGDGHEFVLPVKRINDEPNVHDFLQSLAYRDIISFLMQLNRSMFPLQDSQSDESSKSPIKFLANQRGRVFTSPVSRIRELFIKLTDIIDEAPPKEGPRRFGNVSFRQWYSLVEERAQGLLEQHLAPSLQSFEGEAAVGAIWELREYLLGSFGSPQRLDYGTGHELSFLAFLGGIWKLRGFGVPDGSGDQEREIVIGLWPPYLDLVRRLIITYNLEPAGSHGVWGLDDHSFLPYIFGSAQYGPAISKGDPVPTEGSVEGAPKPSSVTDPGIVQRERGENLYFGAIGFIYDVKKGPFWEHSPILYDISGVRAGWGKINKGMLKMYNAEVLSKFPVVQHFPFGGLFAWGKDPAAIELAARPPPRAESRRPNAPETGARTPPIDGSSPPLVSTAAPWTRNSLASGSTAASRIPPGADDAASGMPGPMRAPWATAPASTAPSVKVAHTTAPKSSPQNS